MSSPYLRPADAGTLSIKLDEHANLTMSGVMPRDAFTGALRKAQSDPRHTPAFGFVRVLIKYLAAHPRDGQTVTLSFQGADRRAHGQALPAPKAGLTPIAWLGRRDHYLQGHSFVGQRAAAMLTVGEAPFIRTAVSQVGADFLLAIGPATEGSAADA